MLTFVLLSILSVSIAKEQEIKFQCDESYRAPVCCIDNSETFGSPCLAWRAQCKELVSGKCKPDVDEPVSVVQFSSYSDKQQDKSVHSTLPQPSLDLAFNTVRPCVCDPTWKPVCGEDGKTYGSKCIARECFDYKGTFNKGVCEPADCLCHSLFQPVCSGKVTYGNQCRASCSGDYKAAEGVCPDSEGKKCVCDNEGPPVCANGLTIVNACQAECFGITDYRLGDCSSMCGCDMTLVAPVCAKDNMTYKNHCHAVCLRQEVKSKGLCDRFIADASSYCGCPADFDPVCVRPQCDGGEFSAKSITFLNWCESLCNGYSAYTAGECRPQCDCPETFEIVCGESGETYQNECYAECNGELSTKPGVCLQLPTYDEIPPATKSSEGKVHAFVKGQSKSCSCWPGKRPVCGQSGKTYKNKCFAKCAGDLVVKKGPCSKPL